jgi:hypothetical protein
MFFAAQKSRLWLRNYFSDKLKTMLDESCAECLKVVNQEKAMGDDAEYEMERQEEERRLAAARGPRDINEILANVHARIASANFDKAQKARSALGRD